MNKLVMLFFISGCSLSAADGDQEKQARKETVDCLWQLMSSNMQESKRHESGNEEEYVCKDATVGIPYEKFTKEERDCLVNNVRQIIGAMRHTDSFFYGTPFKNRDGYLNHQVRCMKRVFMKHDIPFPCEFNYDGQNLLDFRTKLLALDDVQ